MLNTAQMKELLLQSLEHEKGGVQVYQTALECVRKAKVVLQAAYDQVVDEEDEHLYHTKGWCRELWLKSLGLTSVLPPTEEKRGVKTAEGAAKVEKQRKKAVAA
jgi:rubrerythrin